MVLGDALSSIRQARVFADTPERRQSLAAIEVLLVEHIEAQTDSVVREAAWSYADCPSCMRTAEAQRRAAEELASMAQTARLRDEVRQEELTREYRYYVERAAELLSPGTTGKKVGYAPKERCASVHWRRLYSAALEAAAR